jgi:hypothetical protein
MNSDSGILDICIPTYNRLKQLKHNVDIFIDVICRSEYKSKIKLIISNNGSLDQTKEYLNYIDSRYEFVKILDQKINIGFLENIRKLWHASDASRIWTISDDDYYEAELIETVIYESIADSNSGIFIINSFHYSEDSNGKINKHRTNMLNLPDDFEKRNLTFRGIFDLVDGKNYSAFGLLGAIVFPKELTKTFLMDYSNSDTSYPHQLLLFATAADTPVKVFNSDGLGWRVDGSNWSTDKVDASFKAHYVDYVDILSASGWLTKQMAHNIYSSVYRNSYKAILLHILNHRKDMRWIVSDIFKNHFKYGVFHVKFDAILIFIALFQFKLINKFIGYKIKKSIN